MKPSDLRFISPEKTQGDNPIKMDWLGTAGFRFDLNGEVLLIDPYLSRPSLTQCLVGKISPNKEILKEHFPKARVILVGHSHFDHVMDVPFIAAQTGATVYGARSTINYCLASGLPAKQMVEIAPGMVFEDGPFKVTVIKGEHGKLVRGKEIPFDGEIESCDCVPDKMGAFKCGQVNWFLVEVGGQRFVHQGSAELAPDTPILETDHLLTCVAGWTYAQKLHYRLMHHFNPGQIFLCHYDNFFQPITKGDNPLPLMKMPKFVDEFRKEGHQGNVWTITPLQPVYLSVL